MRIPVMMIAASTACASPASGPSAASGSSVSTTQARGSADVAAPGPPAQEVPAPWIGIALDAGVKGTRVKQVIDEAPGARAGLLVGDEVLAIDGVPTPTPQTLMDLVAGKGVGSRVVLSLDRAGAGLTVELVLEAKPEMLAILRRKVLTRPAPTEPLADAYGPYPAASLAAYRGQVVLVELGASWCGFCRASLPVLERWQREHGAAGLRVVWISSEDLETIRAVEPAVTGVTRARDPGAHLAGTIGSTALPTFLLVDRAGIVRAADVGAGDATLAVLAAQIQQLLAEP